MLLEDEELPAAKDAYGRPTPRWQLIVMVDKSKFNAHIVATSAEDYPQGQLKAEEVAA
jgi:hypothetical protein